MRVLPLLASVALTACAAQPHPLEGPSHPQAGELGYFIATDASWLVINLHANDRAHRFQGSVTPTKGALRDLVLGSPTLSETVALQNGTLEFDVEVAKNSHERIRVRMPHDTPCAKFDLYLDGSRRTERVYLAADQKSPTEVPFERCR
ncbi:MAG: hypothetical protein ABI321_22770 [Polyangia bacterium]